MKVALIKIEVLNEADGISTVRSVGAWGNFDYEFYVPTDTIVDGCYLKVIDFDNGEFGYGTETFTYEDTLFDLD